MLTGFYYVKNKLVASLNVLDLRSFLAHKVRSHNLYRIVIIIVFKANKNVIVFVRPVFFVSSKYRI